MPVLMAAMTDASEVSGTRRPRLDEGLLLYAETTRHPSVHRVVRAGPILRVETVDLTGSFDDVLGRCKTIASEIATRVAAIGAATKSFDVQPA